MKHTKILSVFIAIIMSVSMLSSFLVTAAETEEKIYTLNELLEMSDEEFLALDGTSDYKDELIAQIIDSNERFYGDYYIDEEFIIESDDLFIEERFAAYTYEDVNYVSNITEQKINYLLRDSYKYSIYSPIQTSGYYEYLFSILFYEDFSEMTYENIMIMTKIGFCLNQVMTVSYGGYGFWDPAPGSKIIAGDTNLDETVDLYDVIWITKYIAQIYEFPDGQKAVADISGDGVVNVVDAIMLAEHVTNPEENPI